MTPEALQALCELGQQQLMAMEYLQAEATLARAEAIAWSARDWDTLARLYLPLQEARRQRRQRCGEGIVVLDLLAEGPEDALDPAHIVAHYPHGQLLVAGWGSIAPALGVRRLAEREGFFVETFLAAAYPTPAGRVVAIVPRADADLPDPVSRSAEGLSRLLPAHTLLLSEKELPQGSRKGTFQTYGEVMALWERLHSPFLAAADAEQEPIRKIEAYRRTLDVDYACELAHQKLSDEARRLAARLATTETPTPKAP